MASSPVIASSHIHSLLSSLHAASLTQEHSDALETYWQSKHAPGSGSELTWTPQDDAMMRDKFIALEPEKCEFVYLLACSTGATHIVEAGTSFGVSTIYLALAVGQNVAAKASSAGGGVVPGEGGWVIGTEKEAEKAMRARAHWKEAGKEVEPWITLLEGDLTETVPKELAGRKESVDLLLLDIWAPMALPALKAVQPRLRHGAVVITDNTGKGIRRYAEFLAYIHDQKNGFRAMTIPFPGGLELAIYLPDKSNE